MFKILVSSLKWIVSRQILYLAEGDQLGLVTILTLVVFMILLYASDHFEPQTSVNFVHDANHNLFDIIILRISMLY